MLDGGSNCSQKKKRILAVSSYRNQGKLPGFGDSFTSKVLGKMKKESRWNLKQYQTEFNDSSKKKLDMEATGESNNKDLEAVDAAGCLGFTQEASPQK